MIKHSNILFWRADSKTNAGATKLQFKTTSLDKPPHAKCGFVMTFESQWQCKLFCRWLWTGICYEVKKLVVPSIILVFASSEICSKWKCMALQMCNVGCSQNRGI